MKVLVFRVWHISVPYHPEVLSTHQNHFCLLARRGDRGFQIDGRETRTETLQTWQARLRECHTCPICQHFPAWSYGNQGHRIPHAAPRRPPMCALCDDVPVIECNNDNEIKINDIMSISVIIQTWKHYLGPLPYIQLNPQTRPFIIASNHGLDSDAPEAIRSQRLAVAISPGFSGDIPILYPAPHCRI